MVNWVWHSSAACPAARHHGRQRTLAMSCCSAIVTSSCFFLRDQHSVRDTLPALEMSPLGVSAKMPLVERCPPAVISCSWWANVQITGAHDR